MKMASVRAGFSLTLLCAAFLAQAASAQITDTSVYVPPQYQALAPPSAGSSYVDPVFGTTISRITDAQRQQNADRGGNLTFITDEYSTMSPFNQDGSRLLLLCESYFALYDGNGGFIRNLPLEISASGEPRWSRKDPAVLFYVRGNQLKKYDTANGAVSVVHTFSEYRSITGKGESDICFDGDHFVFAGDGRYVFVYELSSGRKGLVLDTGGRSFDSIYITPDDHVTITWLQAGTGRYKGIELFDRNLNFLRQVSRAGGHMDVTRDANGEEVLILTNSADPAPVCDNGIVKVRLADGKQTCLLSLDWSLAVHVSAPDKSEWCFVETYAPSDPTASPAWKKYTNEVLQIKLDGTSVRRLAHHRSRPFNSYNYQPHVAVSRDATKIVYNSNFGLQASLSYPAEYSDVYLMRVPGEASTAAVATSGTGGTGGTPTPGGGGTTPAPSVIRAEQDNNAVQYKGSWFSNSQAGHSNGTAKLAMDAGSSASFAFSGTEVRWIGYGDPWSGIAKVYVDGQLAGTVDTFDATGRSQKVLFAKTGLQDGNHTLTVEAAGTRGTASGGCWIWIDAFEFVTSGQLAGNIPEPAGTAALFISSRNGAASSSPTAVRAAIRGASPKSVRRAAAAGPVRG